MLRVKARLAYREPVAVTYSDGLGLKNGSLGVVVLDIQKNINAY